MQNPKKVGQGDPAGEKPRGKRVTAWIEPERYTDPFVRSTICAVNLLFLLSGRHFEAGRFRLELKRALASLGACPPVGSSSRA